MVAELETELESRQGVGSEKLATEVEWVKAELVEEKDKCRQLWRTTCQVVDQGVWLRSQGGPHHVSPWMAECQCRRSLSEPDGGITSEGEGHVAMVTSDTVPAGQPSIPSLLETEALYMTTQHKDPQLLEILCFLEREELPLDTAQARKIALQAPLFVTEDDTLFFLDPWQGQQKRAVMPSHLREQVLKESH